MGVKYWKGLFLVVFLCLSLTTFIPVVPVRAVRQISGSETWSGVVQLTEDVHVVGTGSLTIDGAVVAFDLAGSWFCIRLYDSATMLVKNNADLEGKIPVGFGGLLYDQWIGDVWCFDTSSLTVRDSKVGQIHPCDSSTVALEGTYEVHRLYHNTEDHYDDILGTVQTSWSRSSNKPVIQSTGMVSELYVTVTTSGSLSVSGTALVGTYDFSCDVKDWTTIERTYLFLEATGTAVVDIVNPSTDSHYGVWWEVKTRDKAKVSITALAIDITKEPIDKQVGLTSLQTTIKAFGTGTSIYTADSNIRTGVQSDGELVWVKNTWVSGTYYSNPDPNLWGQFGEGSDQFAGWYNPFSTPLTGGGVTCLDDRIQVDKAWVGIHGNIHIQLTITCWCINGLIPTDYVNYFWYSSPQSGCFNGEAGAYPFPCSLIIQKDKAADPEGYMSCTVEWAGPLPNGAPVEIGCYASGGPYIHFGDAMITLHEEGYQLTPNSSITPI